MGGLGSGSWGRRGRLKISEMYALDIRYLSRRGLLLDKKETHLTWTMNSNVIGQIYVVGGGEKSVGLKYRYRENGDTWIDVNYKVQLNWTDCHLSGKRAWFLCPGCARRVAFLYGRKFFLCRYCHDLAYDSESESTADRLARKAEKVRNELGWKPGILNRPGSRPKGMHQLTFMKLQVKYLNYTEQALVALKKQLRYW